MNKQKIDWICQWFLRLRYFRILCIGAALISFSIGLFFSEYSIINKPDFDIFIGVLTFLLGITFSFIGLYYRVETENGIKEKNKN